MNKLLLILTICLTFIYGTTVAYEGKKVTLNSDGMEIGDKSPFFLAVTKDLKEVFVGGKKRNKIQIIAFVPSLDTGVCKLETLAFNRKIKYMENVIVTIVSKDLPFAIERFCNDNNIKNIRTVSDYKDSNNALRYGATISSPVYLEGLFGRVVYIIDKKGIIRYIEVVNEIKDEPNYKKILRVVRKLNREFERESKRKRYFM